MWTSNGSPRAVSQLTESPPPWPDIATAAGLRLAQCTVLYLGLGLAWEFLMLRRASLPWRVLRDFRNIKSLSTPILAIVVSVITALATALAATVVSNAVPTPSDPAPGQSPSTARTKPP